MCVVDYVGRRRSQGAAICVGAIVEMRSFARSLRANGLIHHSDFGAYFLSSLTWILSIIYVYWV